MFCKIKPVIKDLNDKSAKTLVFAAFELQKYLEMVLEGDFPVIHTSEYKENDENTIYLGVDLTEKLEKAIDPTLDDNIYIDVENFSGIITGTNPRSVLIGAYRFLREKDYVFLRPGKVGEIIPETVDGSKVLVSEKASYRYRAITIEGSVYQENLMDLIDWMPKVAMNGYFVQFVIPQVFFDRYYSDTSYDIEFVGKYREGHIISPEEVSAMLELLEIEIEKRDLQYHSIGHGWTSMAFGIESTTWENYKDELTEEQISMMAEIDGKRGLYMNSDMCTQLCMSNPEARDRLTNEIVEYLKVHKNVTHLYYWFADGGNNFCECEECSKLRFSDYYVKSLNELDEKLTKEEIDTKIVFLTSAHSYWKPIQEKISNPDRFAMMIAPITRRFSEPLYRDENVKMKEYNGNKSEYPKYGVEVISYLDDWKKDYPVDCLDFDYHYIWEHIFDFTQIHVADVFYKDLRNFRELGIDGLVSCQVQRAFMPTSLGMHVMARTLWNREEVYEDIERETLLAEFGENYYKVLGYLKEVAQHNIIKVIRCEAYLSDSGVAEDLQKCAKTLDDFEAEILANMKKIGNAQIKDAWERLHFHNRLYRKMIEYYINFNNSNNEELENEIYDYAKKYEQRFKDVFDAYYFCWTFALLVKPRLKRVEIVK